MINNLFQRYVSRLSKTNPLSPGRQSKTFLILCLILFVFSLAGCAKTPDSSTLPPTDPAPEPNPSTVSPLDLTSYFPLKAGNSWSYKGTGNEYAAFKRTVDFQEDNKAQVVTNNGGTIVVDRYETSPEAIIITYRQSESYDKKSILAEPSNIDLTLIKQPLTSGSSWSNGEDTYEITGITETVSVPAGTFNDCIAVKITSKNNSSTTTNYYKQGIGLVKTVTSLADGYNVSSELEAYDLK